MRRAVQERTTGFVVLKPVTAGILITFVGVLCVLSFAVGSTQARPGSRMPMLSMTTSDSHVKLSPAADNITQGTDAKAVETTDKAQVAKNDTREQIADSSSSAEPVAENIEPQGEWETVRMRVTAYCPCPKCCGEYSDGITACGHKIRPGDVFVAADRRFAFQTEMVIEGYGNSQPVKVLDRGGAIKGNKLDVFFMTHQEALEWGVRHIDVKVRRTAASS